MSFCVNSIMTYPYPSLGGGGGLVLFGIVLFLFLLFFVVYTFNIIKSFLGCVRLVFILGLNLSSIGCIYLRLLGLGSLRK